MSQYYWKMLDTVMGRFSSSRAMRYYHNLGSVKSAVKKYIAEYWPDSDPEDIVVEIYEVDGAVHRLVYSSSEKYSIDNHLQNARNQYSWYWKALDMVTGKLFTSLPKCYRSLESAKSAVEEYIAEHLSDSDPEDIIVEIYEAKDDCVNHRLVYSAPKKYNIKDYYSLRLLKSGGVIDDIDAEKGQIILQELKEKGIDVIGYLASMRPDQYGWIIMDWVTGDSLGSGKTFRNAADAKRSLKMHIRRLVAKGRDPEDLRFQVTKYSPKTGRTEIVYADPRDEEGKRLLDQYKEHMLSEWDLEGSDKEEGKRLIEMVQKIRRGSVPSIFREDYEKG